LKLKSVERITKRKINLQSLLDQVSDPKMGGIVAFIGTVRDYSKAGKVEGIFYDAYVPMAEKRMLEVEKEVKAAYPRGKFAIQHRVGRVGVGGVTLVVAASSSHRADAYAACRLGLELLKQNVPIWKKERLADGGHHWVEGEEMGGSKKKRSKTR
jgi:molybdopterin synthase catalytic subunit